MRHLVISNTYYLLVGSAQYAATFVVSVALSVYAQVGKDGDPQVEPPVQKLLEAVRAVVSQFQRQTTWSKDVA